MSNLDPEPPVARVVRGGGSRFRAVAKHRARRVAHGLGKLVRIGAILGFVLGIFALGSLGGSGTHRYDRPSFDVEKLMRELRASESFRLNQQQWIHDLQRSTEERLRVYRAVHVPPPYVAP